MAAFMYSRRYFFVTGLSLCENLAVYQSYSAEIITVHFIFVMEQQKSRRKLRNVPEL